MVYRTFKSEPKKDNPHNVDVRQLYNESTAQAMHITLESGESLKPHKTPVDVFFYILQGTPTVHIDDESRVFDKDTLVESPANLVHFISNESGQPARILVVKAPRPEKQTKIL